MHLITFGGPPGAGCPGVQQGAQRLVEQKSLKTGTQGQQCPLVPLSGHLVKVETSPGFGRTTSSCVFQRNIIDYKTLF